MNTEKTAIKHTENTRIALLEQSIGHINETLKDIKYELRDMRKEIKAYFLWTLMAMTGIVGCLGGLMAKGFHWFS